MSLSLSTASKIAEKIVSELAPFCDQIAIAGSIRRRRSMVNDVDLVCLSKAGQSAALRARILANTEPISDGVQVILTRLANGVQLDVWLAAPGKKDLFEETPTNYGSLLLCRTGSKEHNIWLCERAKRLGFRWNPHFGVFNNGRLLASATEQSIFDVLQLDFVPPEKRER